MKKATFNKEQFIKALTVVLPFHGKTTLPIIDNVRFVKTKYSAIFTVTDLEQTIEYTMDTINGDEFAFCFEGKPVLELLKMSADEIFILHHIDDHIRIELFDGLVEFPVYSVDEFPEMVKLEEPKKTMLPINVLVKRKGSLLNFVGSDELRPVMTGVNVECIEGDQGRFMYIVATDAHKMFVEKMICDVEPMSLTLPKRLINNLDKIGKDGSVMAFYTESHIRLTKDNITIISRLMEGKYPNWRSVIPVSPFYIEVDRLLLIKTISKARIASNEATKQIELRMKENKITIGGEDINVSKESKFTMPANIFGPSLTIGFNANFFLTALEIFTSGMIRIEYSSYNRAILLKGSEESMVTALVMPLMTAVPDKEQDQIILDWKTIHDPEAKVQPTPDVPTEEVKEEEPGSSDMDENDYGDPEDPDYEEINDEI